MKENKLKVSFFVQAKRTDKKGLVPVIGRISVSRTHSGFSTKCKTPLALWDSRKQRLIGKSSMAVSVNQKLGECTALGKSSVRCPLKPSDSIPLCQNNPAH